MPGIDTNHEGAGDDDGGVGAGPTGTGPAAAAPATATGEDPAPGEPTVRSTLEGNVAGITVSGELTEEARRPLIRTMTDLLLNEPTLRRVQLDLREVPFMNSAGMAVLVQLQRMTSPRGIDVALVAPPQAIARALQMSGLWHRFPILEHPEGGR